MLKINPHLYSSSKGIAVLDLDKKNKDWAYIPKDQDSDDGDFIRI